MLANNPNVQGALVALDPRDGHLVAMVGGSLWIVVLVLGALWYGFHAINHAFDVGDARSDARGIFDTLYIGLGAVLFAYLAWAAMRLQAPGTAGDGRPQGTR